MTNFQIITTTAIQQGIFTEEQAVAILESGNELPLHTYAEWKRIGRQVKKGEKAVMQAQIWKMSKAKKAEEDQEEEKSNFFLTKAFFFLESQTETIKQ